MLLVDEIIEVKLRLFHIVSIVVHPAEDILTEILLDIYSDKPQAAFIDMSVGPGR